MPFDKYAVVRKLGAGALGVVWLAHDPQLARDVAIQRPDDHRTDANRQRRCLDRHGGG